MLRRILFFMGLIAGMALVFTPAGFAKSANSNGGSNGNSGGSSNAGGQSAGKGNTGENSKLDIFNIKGIKSGLIKVDKNIFYPTDTLDISIVFPKSLKAVWNGYADAYIVIRMADGTMLTPFQVLSSTQTPDTPKSFVTLDLSQTPLTSGTYQLGLVMVVPGGDALDLGDWYKGFSGLISATTFEVADQCDMADGDCDGIVEASGLVVTPDSITPAAGVSIPITVANGQAPYTITVTDDTVASVSATELSADGTVDVTGIANGQTTITVTDLVGDEYIVDVTVQDTVAVSADPVSASVAVSETTTITASGGVGGFTATSADDTVATVSVSGSTVTVTGVSPGSTSVTIADGNGDSVSVDVVVSATTAAQPLAIDPASAAIAVSETVTVNISGGSGDYTATSADDTIATVLVSGDAAVVTGSASSAVPVTITFEDSDGNTVAFEVTVN